MFVGRFSRLVRRDTDGMGVDVCHDGIRIVEVEIRFCVIVGPVEGCVGRPCTVVDETQVVGVVAGRLQGPGCPVTVVDHVDAHSVVFFKTVVCSS